MQKNKISAPVQLGHSVGDTWQVDITRRVV